jgi:hypothetical protein
MPVSAMFGAALALAAVAQPVHAETQVNATGACKSALPVFDGNIRSRPLGVRNEGTASAFVSCSLPAEHDSEVSVIGLYISNTSGASATVNCTLVNGRNTFSPTYTPQSVVFPGNGSQWATFDPGETPQGGDLVNFSCSLPPGTEINMLATVPPAPI